MVNPIGDNSISISDLEVSYKNKIELLDIKEGDKISIFSDNMFKTMFQNENRLKYSAKLISYLIDVDYGELLKKIQLVKNNFSKKKSNEVIRTGDYVAQIKGSYIAIEVNNNGSMEILERNMEYAHRLYASQIRRKKKHEKVKKKEYSQVILINLNNFSFKGNDKIIDTYSIRNEENIILTKKLVNIQIYIPNLVRKWYNLGVQNLNEMERYLLTLVLQKGKDSKEVGGGNQFMEEYIKDATEASLDEELLVSYDKEKALYELGTSEGEKQGYERGEKQGFEKGEKSGRREVAKNLLELGMKIEEIMKVTGLTEKEINE